MSDEDAIVEYALRDLDDEIRRALDVEPSEGFVRGVYARIERQSRVSSASASSRWWAAGVAAAIVVAVAFGMTPSEEVFEPASPSTRRAPDVNLALQEQPPVPTARARRVPIKREPEVIVAPGTRRATERFVRLARSGVLDASILPPANDAPVAELVVAPLAIEPIAIPDVELVITPRGEGEVKERER